jgi:hypothetical protein
MTAKVLAYLLSLLPPRGGRMGTRPLEHIDVVLREFDELAPNAQQKVAQNLAELWHSFIEQFGGLEGFLIGDEVRRSDYIQRVEAVARRMSNARGSDKAHYFFATMMLAHYLRALHEGATEVDSQRLASRAASLIDEGRKLLPAPKGEAGAVH